MLEKLKAFFQLRTNESGALPAIMAGAILISATAVLLAGFSVTLTRNAEVNVSKTNANYYLNSCESLLETVVYETLPSQYNRDGNANGRKDIEEDLDAKLAECQRPDVNVRITKIGSYEQYKPEGSTKANSVKVNLKLAVTKTGWAGEYYSQDMVKYLDYSATKDYVPSGTAYISSFDENGDAVWVEPEA